MAFEDIDLNSVLAIPTEYKESPREIEINSFEGKTSTEEISNYDFEDFYDEEEEEEEEDIVQNEIITEPYNAEEEAEKLINVIDAGNQLLLTPLAMLRLKKKRGGKKLFAKMEKALTKEVMGEELTENDKILIANLRKYEKDLQLITTSIPFSKEQREALIRAAIPMCKEKKMKTNSSVAFYGTLLAFEADRITKILTT